MVKAMCGSVYVLRLKEWTAEFQPEQLLLLRFSKFIADPRPTLLAAGQHLGLLTPGRQQTLQSEQAAKLPRENSHTIHLKASRAEGKPGLNTTMSPAVRARLSAFFEPWDEQLRQLIRESAFGQVDGQGGGGGEVGGAADRGSNEAWPF